MKFVSFIERCQGDVIERILRHCGQWEGPIRTGAGPRAPPGQSHRVSAELLDPQFVPDLESESRESESRKFGADATRELQLVLDPDFL